MWIDSGISETKSQKLSCADWACGKPRSGSCFTAWIEVGELDRVLDEEHRDVVADEVPVALLGVELDREAAHVAGQVERALAAGDGREADERRGPLAGPLEEVGPGEVGQRLVGLEVAVGAVAAGVHDALGDALVVEVEDLLAEVEVLEQRRAALADPQRVLVVGDRNALLGGQPAGPLRPPGGSRRRSPRGSGRGSFAGFFVVAMRQRFPARAVSTIVRRSA